MGDHPRITLDEVSLGFQPANQVVFDIKNSVLVNLKTNQFTRRKSEDCNARLTLFIDMCNTINPSEISEEDKRLWLFGYFLTRRSKDWLDALLRGAITTWEQLIRKFLDRYFPTTKYL